MLSPLTAPSPLPGRSRPGQGEQHRARVPLELPPPGMSQREARAPCGERTAGPGRDVEPRAEPGTRLEHSVPRQGQAGRGEQR